MWQCGSHPAGSQSHCWSCRRRPNLLCHLHPEYPAPANATHTPGDRHAHLVQVQTHRADRHTHAIPPCTHLWQVTHVCAFAWRGHKHLKVIIMTMILMMMMMITTILVMQHPSSLAETQLNMILSLLSLLLCLPLPLLMLLTNKIVDLSVKVQLLSLLASSLAVQGQSTRQAD